MSKPISGLTVFSGQSPPWPLTSLDANFETVEEAVNDFGTYSNYLTDTSGTANAIVAAIASGATFTLGPGVCVQVKVANTTTSSTVTANIANTGNVTLIHPNQSALLPGEITAGQVVNLLYDGMYFQLLSPSGASAYGAGPYLNGGALAAGNTNNFSPSGFGPNVGRLDVAANASGSTLTGLLAGIDGQIVVLRNLPGGGVLSLPNANSGSLAANQFSTPTGATVTLPAGARTTAIYYAGSFNYWSLA